VSEKIENTSGWFPLLHRVLVKPTQTDIEKAAEASGIQLVDSTTALDAQVQVEGTVIATGPEVFCDQPNSTVPSPGDLVMFGKLSGFFVRGYDGKKYRMINDLDLVAIGSPKND
jgi:co-chaperonin GroES (HSP10)